MPKSLSYHEHKIQFLKNPEASAAYIEAILEEKDPEPELLQRTLSNVVEALAEQNMTPEQVKLHYKKLDELFAQHGSDVIYSLANWLNELGLKLSVTVCEDSKDQQENFTNGSEVTVE